MANGSSGGTLGICLQNAGGRVIVDAVDSRSPNSAAVRTGDVIAAVNGVNVLGLPLSAVRPLLAGPVGTPARLSVLRPEGEAVLSLVRHEPPVQPAVQGGQLVTVPLHKLVVWDHGHAQQVATATSRNSMQTPQGFLDVTVVDVENLPVCYEVGWSITSLGTGTATPYVEASVKTCRLRTGSQTGKLSAAINNTLRLPVVDTSPLRIRVKNDDVSMGGNIIGEIKFPMQQIANDGFQQKGRFRITVVCHLGERIPTLQHLEEGDEVTGLKNRPSTVHLELSYRGRPYREMQAAEMQADELKRVNNERIFLEEEHRHLLDERRRVEIEEKGLLERDSKEAQALAGAAVKKAQREAKVREEVYALSKTKLAEEREAWLLGKRSTEQIHLGAMPHKHEIFEEAPHVQSTQKPAESKAWWDILPAMPSMPSMPTMPTITMPKVDLTQESIQSDKRNLANVELVLDMDMAVVGDDEAFKREVEEDVMASLGPAAKKCRVSSIRAGSVIVDLHVELAPGVHEKEAARILQHQAMDPTSPLMRGKHTRYTKNVLSPTHTIPHVHHEQPELAAPVAQASHRAVESVVAEAFEPNLNEMLQAVERRMRLREIQSVPGEADKFECQMIPDAEPALRAIAAAGYEVVLVAVAVPWVAELAVKHLQSRGMVGSNGSSPIHDGNVLFCLEATEKAVLLQKMGGFVVAVDRNWTICDSILQNNADLHAMLFNPDEANEAAFLQDIRVAQADAYALHELVQQYGTRQVERMNNPSEPEHISEMARLAPLIQQLHKKVSSLRSLVPASRLPANSAAMLPTPDPSTVERPWLQVCDMLHVPQALVQQFENEQASASGQHTAIPFKYPLAASDDEATLQSLRTGHIPHEWEPIQDKETSGWFFVNHRVKTSSWLLPVHSADDTGAAGWMQRSRRNQQQLLGDVGIGITLSKDASGRLRVVELQDGGPAQKSQRVKLDDVVLSINGANVSKESEHEAMARLIGQPDTPVVLRLQQGSDVDGLANKVTWSQLVTMSEPDPESPNEEHFIVNGLRLTVPAEDDQGVFSVRDAKTNVLVYFGPGRYKGVWDILCAEGQQVASRPEIFMWRGQELYQPEYDARGIATVRDARTRDVVYRGPGDSYVPGHPGNSSQACPFVWLVRSHARAKRGRVMVDLARVVVRLVPKGSAHGGHVDDVVLGCTIQLGCDFRTAIRHHKTIKRQLRRDLAAALQVPCERFSTCLLEPGSVMAKFNVIPAAAVGLGGPSATELADKLVTQAKDSNSLLRRQPLTRCAVHATVHKALDPSLPNMNDTEEDALEQVAADQEIQESGVPSISVYITGVRSLPLVQGTRKADVFLELELHGVLVSTKVVPADDAGTATFNSILRLPVRQGREGMSKVHVRIFDVAQALEGQAIGELSYTVDGLRHNYQNKEVNEGWFNVRGPNMGVVQGVGGDYAAVQLRIEYVPGASEASSTTVPTTVYPVYPVSHAALPPQPASAVSGEVSALPVLKPPLVLAAPGGDAHAPVAPRAVTTQLPTPPPVLSSSVGPAANIQAAAVQQGTLPLPHQITPPLPHKSAAATAVVNIMMLRSLPKMDAASNSTYIELRIGDKSVKSNALATASSASDSIVVYEILELEVPIGEERGKLSVVLVDGQSRKDMGEIVFPVHKLAAVGSVQGWYHLKEPGGVKAAPEIMGYNEATGINDGQTTCVKCSLSIHGTLNL